MKITIITPTYNGARTLSRTLESILEQSDVELEHIIVDGRSSDETIQVIKDYLLKNPKALFISEKDKNLYDAINKGLKMATGEIVGILNSDDNYTNSKTLSTIANSFTDKNISACYGDLIIVKRNGPEKIIRYWNAEDFHPDKIQYGWSPPHPAFFVRREIYDQVGLFRTDLPIASDYEFMFRVMNLPDIKMKYIPRALVQMKDGGISSRNIINRLKGWNDIRKAWKINKVKLPPLFITKRIFSKIKQYILINKTRNI